MIRHPDIAPLAQEQIAVSLGRAPTSEGVALLGELWSTSQIPSVRAAATKALGRARGPDAEIAIAEALSDPDASVAAAARIAWVRVTGTASGQGPSTPR